ncbi:MAG: hypothetical protein GX635_07100, partial [Synergistaceae bacterium]|nr:hypothetical protein [Synergistaceae bacterium]
PGTALVITGPGLTNILTPMGQAFHDSVPMVVISTQIPSRFLSARSGYLHELRDSITMSSSVTKGSFRASSPSEIAPLLERAYRVASAGRPGPVHVEIPLDYLSAPCVPPGTFSSSEQAFFVPDEYFSEALRALGQAEFPVILAGGGASRSGVALRGLAEALNAPVLLTCAGKGILSEEHPLCLGARLHFPAVRELLAKADCLLALGTEISPTDLWLDEFEFSGTVVTVDIDEGHRASRNGVFLHGRCEEVTPLLLAGVHRKGAPQWTEKSALLSRCSQELGATLGVTEELPLLARTTGALKKSLGDDGTLWADMTGPAYYAISEYAAARPGGFLHPVGFGTLGAALPAALATKCAFPERRVAALAGDGGFQFTLPELAVGVQEKLSLPVILWNDGGFGEIRRSQQAKGGPLLAVDHWNPDFRALAASYGVPYFAPEDGALGDALEEAFAAPVPSLIEIRPRKEYLE